MRTRSIRVAVCDGCDEHVPIDGKEPPFGYRGTVEHHHMGGGIGGVKWFACKSNCIVEAIVTALERAEADR